MLLRGTLSLFLMVYGCVPQPQDRPDADLLKADREVKSVLAFRAVPREIPYIFQARGKTVASERLAVKPPEGGGKVEKIFVEEGQRVEVGQRLIQFAEEELRLKLDLARSQLEEAELAVEDLRRQEARPKPQEEPEEETGETLTEAAPQNREEKIALHEATITRARNELELYETQLQDLEVKSPLAGLITKRDTAEGEIVEESKVILEIVRIDPIHFTFEVPLDVAATLERGKGMVAKFPQLRNLEASGEILSIGAEAVGQGQVEIKLTLPNEALTLKGEMEGEITIPTNLKKKVLTIPERCLSRTERSTYLFKVVDGKVKRAAVELEGETGGQSIIERGIEERDLIVASELEGLKEGDTVEVQTIPTP